MTISKIAIKNIKGIGDKTFELNITPNKPSLLVAPNGFGKSSFATAFDSLRSNRVELEEAHFFMDDQDNFPQITIEYKNSDGTVLNLVADKQSNSINQEFSCFVINSQIKAKGSARSFGGRNIVKASLEIEDVTLIDTIPERAQFNYSLTSQKSDFGRNGKVLPNISSLFANLKVVEKLSNSYSDLDELLLVRNNTKILNLIRLINDQNGTREEIHDYISRQLHALSEIEPLKKVVEIISSSENELTNAYLAAIQIVNVYKTDKTLFKKACKYCNYNLEVESYASLLKAINTSWKVIRPEKSGNKLVVKFPKAHQVSNGQRDVLSFIALIIRAKRKLNKDKCILIIDEVFDYLDDANLISAQYYVTQLIDEFKAADKELYPLILTHLNPRYFRNYAFSKQKVYYLDKRDGRNVNPHFKKILQKRNDGLIQDDVSKYLLHFHPLNINKKSEFQTLGLKATWGEGEGFKQFIDAEIQKFIASDENSSSSPGSTGSYDPLAICCGVRRNIEKVIYDLLSTNDDKNVFLDIHGTRNKLEFAEERGVSVPEYFYLLGIVYNDGMHWKDNHDNVSPIAVKLENITIRKLIVDVFEFI
ncbi:hypothetical protein EV210_12117 [Anaerospora hongkongensis]|uniref:Uncharacterized protein n=1 Tax=Anaerospora hongkongensis TaxID=244830 RepID=A0A4R1PMG0_9FIRM|nr:hypothetical protein [Anaerospora hongkongensis]TCL32452.1 hypothetical protein EV210_12117 [Anaerospora hongkongensis]